MIITRGYLSRSLTLKAETILDKTIIESLEEILRSGSNHSLSEFQELLDYELLKPEYTNEEKHI